MGSGGRFCWCLQETMTVTYNSAGGSQCAPKQAYYGHEYGTLCTPTRSGYIFMGWYTGQDGTGSKIGENSIISVGGSNTLYAYWLPNTYI